MRNTTPATKNKVLLLTGIGDDVWLMKLLTWQWGNHHLEVEVFRVGWNDQQSLSEKLNRLYARLPQQEKITLVGISAGGSLAVNAYLQRPDQIDRVITVNSRLRGSYPNKTYQQSIRFFEQHEAQLRQPQNIMTVQARYGDELVPSSTAIIPGAFNITVPFFEHRLSIALALTVFSAPLLHFIQNNTGLHPALD